METQCDVSVARLAMRAVSPDVEEQAQPFEPVAELAMAEYTERLNGLIERLGASVSEDEWLLICKLQIAVGGAIDMAWKAGVVVGSEVL